MCSWDYNNRYDNYEHYQSEQDGNTINDREVGLIGMGIGMILAAIEADPFERIL